MNPSASSETRATRGPRPTGFTGKGYVNPLPPRSPVGQTLNTWSLGTAEGQQASLESGDAGRLNPPVVETKDILDGDKGYN